MVPGNRRKVRHTYCVADWVVVKLVLEGPEKSARLEEKTCDVFSLYNCREASKKVLNGFE